MNRILIFFLIAALITACDKNAVKDSVPDTPSVADQHNDLPALRLTLSDGRKTTARELGGNVVLVLFQPDCDHCQREAEQIAAFSDSFKRYKVYFISSVPVNEIVAFGNTYHLSDKANFFFAQTPFEDVVNNFGPIETPSLYIYSKDKKLVQSFNGEVAMEVVVKYL